jgi:hypothetical protein
MVFAGARQSQLSSLPLISALGRRDIAGINARQLA